MQNVPVNSRFVKYTVPALNSSSTLSGLGCLIIMIIRLRGANWTMINFYSCIGSKTCIFFFLLDRVKASYFTPHASRVTFWRFFFQLCWFSTPDLDQWTGQGNHHFTYKTIYTIIILMKLTVASVSRQSIDGAISSVIFGWILIMERHKFKS